MLPGPPAGRTELEEKERRQTRHADQESPARGPAGPARARRAPRRQPPATAVCRRTTQKDHADDHQDGPQRIFDERSANGPRQQGDPYRGSISAAADRDRDRECEPGEPQAANHPRSSCPRAGFEPYREGGCPLGHRSRHPGRLEDSLNREFQPGQQLCPVDGGRADCCFAPSAPRSRITIMVLLSPSTIQYSLTPNRKYSSGFSL